MCVKLILILLDGVYRRCGGGQAGRQAGDETSALTSTLEYERLFAYTAALFETSFISEDGAKHQSSLSAP